MKKGIPQPPPSLLWSSRGNATPLKAKEPAVHEAATASDWHASRDPLVALQQHGEAVSSDAAA
jgi:hypothetical protein